MFAVNVYEFQTVLTGPLPIFIAKEQEKITHVVSEFTAMLMVRVFDFLSADQLGTTLPNSRMPIEHLKFFSDECSSSYRH